MHFYNNLNHYSLISDDVDMYEDEYDDTYDGDAPVLVSDGNAEADKKLLFKRAPLRETGECLAESEVSNYSIIPQ